MGDRDGDQGRRWCRDRRVVKGAAASAECAETAGPGATAATGVGTGATGAGPARRVDRDGQAGDCSGWRSHTADLRPGASRSGDGHRDRWEAPVQVAIPADAIGMGTQTGTAAASDRGPGRHPGPSRPNTREKSWDQ
jgi:hypothetical protein